MKISIQGSLFIFLLFRFGMSAYGQQRSTRELVDSTITYVYDTTMHAWGHQVFSSVYIYDQSNNLIQRTDRHWVNGGWKDTTQDQVEYDLANNITNYTTEVWGGSYWIATDIRTYTYDVNEVLTGMVDFQAASVNYQQKLYTYTYSGDLLHPLRVLYQNRILPDTVWVNSLLTINTYNLPYSVSVQQGWASGWYDENRVIDSPMHHIQQDWDGTTATNFVQYFFTYDSYGHQLGSIYESWSGNRWDTTTLQRHIYSYDTHQHILTDSLLQLPTYKIVWQLYSIDSFSYDANENKTRRKYLETDWLGFDSTYIYDGGNYLTDVKYFLLSRTQRDSTYGDSTHYYYHTLDNTGINDLSRSSSISIYPVPAHALLSIINDNASPLVVVFYDMTGREVMVTKISAARSQIDISALPPGVYQLSFTGDSGYRSVKRLVVE